MGASWRTTISGVLAIVPQLLHMLFPKYVTVELATGLTTLFIAVGLIQAKDAGVTGGTIPNTTNNPTAVQSTATQSSPIIPNTPPGANL